MRMIETARRTDSNCASSIPVDSSGFLSHSGGFQQIPVIPAGI